MALRVIQLVPALGDGGVERSALEMAKHLSERGVANWLASDGGPLLTPLQAAGTAHVALRVGAKNPAAAAGSALRLARLIDANGINVVHARSRAPAWAGWLATKLARGKPAFVCTFHGTYGHRGRLKRFYNGVMLRGPLVIANSRFIADHIRAVYGVPEARIVTAPRGIDPAAFDPRRVAADTRQRLREAFCAGGAPLLVKVARISRWKGHGVLVEALARLAELPWRMVFVGGGDDAALESRLRQSIARLGLEDRVAFAGSRRDVPEILAAADLAFSVADTAPEAFGRASIEAGAMETPVIATAHGGSLETVVAGETGWLVPPGDAGALADAIREALLDPGEAGRRGAAARRFVLANYTLADMLEKEASVYARLVGGAPWR